MSLFIQRLGWRMGRWVRVMTANGRTKGLEMDFGRLDDYGCM